MGPSRFVGVDVVQPRDSGVLPTKSWFVVGYVYGACVIHMSRTRTGHWHHSKEKRRCSDRDIVCHRPSDEPLPCSSTGRPG